MNIQMHKRLHDGKIEVWADMEVTWGATTPGGGYYRELGFKSVEPVLVEVLDGKGERSSFLAERRDSAPLWAGDGFGASRFSATDRLNS